MIVGHGILTDTALQHVAFLDFRPPFQAGETFEAADNALPHQVYPNVDALDLGPQFTLKRHGRLHRDWLSTIIRTSPTAGTRRLWIAARHTDETGVPWIPVGDPVGKVTISALGDDQPIVKKGRLVRKGVR